MALKLEKVANPLALVVAVFPVNPTVPAPVEHPESVNSDSVTAVEGTPFPYVSRRSKTGCDEKIAPAATDPALTAVDQLNTVAEEADTMMLPVEHTLDTAPMIFSQYTF